MTVTPGSESQFSESDNVPESRERDSSQVVIFVLVVVAVAGSVVMLLVNSATALKVALIAALWAVLLSAFLIYRYRSQNISQREEMELREELHLAELERVAQANGTTIQRDSSRSEKLAEHNTELLEQLREEIRSLRSKLEEYTGRPYEYEPDAIRATAQRVMEVESSSATNARDVTEEIAIVREPEPAPRRTQPAPPRVERPQPSYFRPEPKPEPIPEPEPTPVSAAYSHWAPREDPVVTVADEPVEEPLYRGSHRRPNGAPTPDAIAGRFGRSSAPTANPLSQLISESSDRWQFPSEPETRRAPEPRREPKPEPRREPEPAEDVRHSGRRRLDQHGSGLTVAELLANMKNQR
ncbi:DUF6779 domain-containing protein [Corynebacterium uterequi]|uniref:DUF6779 domain-containing protein n=1 Tax=Corynebacterium uterequi TaxID=1072256 RepID=A0A0G3HL85_9CORY|nr:DUF6779 domain-containing protein [Corynebacterium uterequi]AKK11872.1 hypothetical protein CUTER_09520 [Corynebacterium uterequi]